jgi:hypothetical protein
MSVIKKIERCPDCNAKYGPNGDEARIHNRALHILARDARKTVSRILAHYPKDWNWMAR